MVVINYHTIEILNSKIFEEMVYEEILYSVILNRKYLCGQQAAESSPVINKN